MLLLIMASCVTELCGSPGLHAHPRNGDHRTRFGAQWNEQSSQAAVLSGKDYPEGRVIHPQRGTPWFEMKEYQQHYKIFQKLKPEWTPPGEKTKRKKNDR